MEVDFVNHSTIPESVSFSIVTSGRLNPINNQGVAQIEQSGRDRARMRFYKTWKRYLSH